MQVIRLFVGVIFLFSMAQDGRAASVPVWPSALGVGGSNTDQGLGVAMDVYQNRYVVGTFKGDAEFGPTAGGGTITISSGGTNDQDIFVAKYSPQGVLLWVIRAGGPGTDKGSKIAVDPSGNDILVSGWFSGIGTFGRHELTSAGESDVFVMKLGLGGGVQWAVRAGGPGNDTGEGIALDANGDVYVVGLFNDTAQFGAETLVAVGERDGFLTKISTNGIFSWVEAVAGAGKEQLTAVALDALGDIYVAGGIGSPQAELGGVVVYGQGSSDAVVARYTPGGAVVWARTAGGPGADEGLGIAVDDLGNSVVVGHFNGQAEFGTWIFIWGQFVFVGDVLQSAGGSDVFVARFSPQGWNNGAVRAGGPSHDSGVDVALDPFEDSAFVTGWFQGQASFGSLGVTSEGSGDVFVAKYQISSGAGLTEEWVDGAGGVASDAGLALAVADPLPTDPSSILTRVIVTGRFALTAEFGLPGLALPPPPPNVLVSAGQQDAFIAEIVDVLVTGRR